MSQDMLGNEQVMLLSNFKGLQEYICQLETVNEQIQYENRAIKEENQRLQNSELNLR